MTIANDTMIALKDICSEWLDTPYFSIDAEISRKNLSPEFANLAKKQEKCKFLSADTFGEFLHKNNFTYLHELTTHIPLEENLIASLCLGDQLVIGILASAALSTLEKRSALRDLLGLGLNAFNFDHYHTIETFDGNLMNLLNRAAAGSNIFPIESLPIGDECEQIVKTESIRTVLDVVQNNMQNMTIGSSDITIGQAVIANAIDVFGYFEPIVHDLIDFFLMHGTKLNLNIENDYFNLLFLASTECFEDHTLRLSVMERLLKMGANPNAVFDYATNDGEGTLLDYYYECIGGNDMFNYCAENCPPNAMMYRQLTDLELEHHKQAEEIIKSYGGKSMSEIRDPFWYKH